LKKKREEGRKRKGFVSDQDPENEILVGFQVFEKREAETRREKNMVSIILTTIEKRLYKRSQKTQEKMHKVQGHRNKKKPRLGHEAGYQPIGIKENGGKGGKFSNFWIKSSVDRERKAGKMWNNRPLTKNKRYTTANERKSPLILTKKTKGRQIPFQSHFCRGGKWGGETIEGNLKEGSNKEK